MKGRISKKSKIQFFGLLLIVISGLFFYLSKTSGDQTIEGIQDAKLFEEGKGVAAVNTTKDVYELGEEVSILIGLVDEQGLAVCNADISLKITDPVGESIILNTKEGQISLSESCAEGSITNDPDYFTTYFSEIKGKYTIELTTIINGEEIRRSNTFRIKEDLIVEISREGPTRISPNGTYVMKINVIPNVDFLGNIIETVPSDFTIFESEDFMVETEGNERYLMWTGVELKQGSEYFLTYTFIPPDTVPDFNLVGPLDFSNYQESRAWQMETGL